MSRSIEIYSGVIVIAFLIEIIAVIIHGTPFALLAYAVTIVMVFLVIVVGMNLHIRQPLNNETIETGEDINKRRTYLENILLTKVVDRDLLARSFPNDNEDEESTLVKDLKILEGQSDVNDDNNNDKSIVSSNKSYERILSNNYITKQELGGDIESPPVCVPCDGSLKPDSDSPINIHSNKSCNTLKIDSKICSICLSEYKIGEKIVYSDNVECNHFFHKECLIMWFMKKRVSCPNCRCEFIHIEDMNNTNNDNSLENYSSYFLEFAS